MTVEEIALLVASAEKLIPLGKALIDALRSSGSGSTEEFLAKANANDDAIIAAAQKELNPPAQ